MKNEYKAVESIDYKEELQLLLKLTLGITSTHNLQEAFNFALGELCKVIGWEAADVWWVNQEQATVEFVSSCSTEDQPIKEFCRKSSEFKFTKGQSLPGLVLQTKNTCWIEDVTNTDWFQRKQAAIEAGITSAVGIPVPLDGQVLAIISLYCTKRKKEDPALLRLLNAIGGQLGMLIHKKQFEDRLINSEMRFRSIVETSPEAIIISDQKGNIIVSNPKAEEMFGYVGNELTLQSIDILKPERFREEYKTRIKKYLDTGDIEVFRKPVELWGLRKDGSEFPVELSIGAWKTNDGFFFTEVIRDITVRKEAEKLRDRFQNIFENSDDSILTKTLDGTVTSWNAASERIYGYTAEEMLGRSITITIPEDYRNEHKEILTRVKNGELIKHFTTKRISKEGKTLFISLSIFPLTDHYNNVIGASTIGRDITADLQGRKEREDLNNFISKVADLIPNVVSVTDLETNKNIWTNKELTETFGYTREDIEGKTMTSLIQEIIHPDDMHIVKERIEKVKELEENETYISEVRLRHKNGEWKWVRSKTGVFETNSDGKPIKTISIIEDITVYKEFESELSRINRELEKRVKDRTQMLQEKNKELSSALETERKYQQLIKEKEETLEIAIQSTNIGTWDFYPLTGQLILSGRTKELCNIPFTGELDKEKAVENVHPDDREKLKAAGDKAMNPEGDGNFDIDFRIIIEENKVRWINARGKAFFNSERKAERLIGIVHNITSMKEQVEKKDEFIGIASHELKTPITSMRGYLQLVAKMMDKEKDDKVYQFVKKAEQSLDKLLRLVDDLLDRTKIQAGKLTLNIAEFNLNQLVDETISHFRDANKKYTILKEGLINNLVKGDRHRIEQVLINYLSNAIKYSPNSKEIIVKLYEKDNSAIVAVKDFGIGIPEHMINRVFDKYYRIEETSQNFSGLGLGLNIASEIINRHKGKVWAESELGKGSTFYFSVPLKKD